MDKKEATAKLAEMITEYKNRLIHANQLKVEIQPKVQEVWDILRSTTTMRNDIEDFACQNDLEFDYDRFDDIDAECIVEGETEVEPVLEWESSTIQCELYY